MNEPTPPDLLEAWQTLTPAQFREDAAAVADYRAFLASRAGKKFIAVIRGANPMLALVTPEAGSPAVIRAAAKQEGESAESLLGKATGYQSLTSILLDQMPVPRSHTTPKSKKAGREIARAAADLP